MKTKRLIELLKEADPSGEIHVRICGEGRIPVSVSCLPGYYDGGYAYEKDGEDAYKGMVITKKGDKVDIVSMDYDNIVWDCEGKMEEIKNKITIEGDQRLWEDVEKTAKQAREFFDKSNNEFIVKVIKKLQEGWSIIQSTKYSIGQHNHMFYIKEGEKEEQQLCQGECGAVIKSGMFKYTVKGENYYWELK